MIWMAGIKLWYASWDTAVLDWLEQDLAAGFRENGKWSFSGAFMVFSHFSQDWDGSAPGMNIASSLDLERFDLDFAVNYTLHKYVKVFVGYKHQKTEIDFTLRYDTLMARRVFDYELEADVSMPTAGRISTLSKP